MVSKSLTPRRNPLKLRSDELVGLASERGGTQLSLADIRTDGGTQMRAGLHEETVREYLEVIQNLPSGAGWPFPPVVVFHDGEAYWMGDGFHRVEAARRYLAQEQQETQNLAALRRIPADVRAGARRDAILYAAGANATHGLRRTNADKRRAVEVLLRDEEWGQWSDREIARRCQVSPDTVGRIRNEIQFSLSESDSEKQKTASLSESDSEKQRMYTTKHGTVARMNISGQREAPRMRIPKGYSPPSAPAPKPPLTLDETLNLIWGAIRLLVQTDDPADRLSWLASLPDDYGFYRDTPADRSMAPETLQVAKAHVVAELRAQGAPELAHRDGKRRRGTLLGNQGTQMGVEGALTGLEQADGAVDQGRAAEWLPPPSGRPRLPRSMRVSKLLSLYQEVLATLDEYSRLVVDSSRTQYADDALRAITAMIAELEKEGVQAA
jgi:hypothetical protein